LNLGFYRATLEKHIAVRSNDPQTPEVSLTIKADYTPLYDLNPMTLAADLPFGVNEAVLFTTITRTDGKRLRITRLETSKPWITATMERGAKPDEAAERIRIAIQRDGPPRQFSEYVHVYSSEQTNTRYLVFTFTVIWPVRLHSVRNRYIGASPARRRRRRRGPRRRRLAG
jgi:hypothetical protein